MYYVAAGGFERGQLIIKPSPHLKDSTLPAMLPDDTQRLLPMPDLEDVAQAGAQVGEYLLVDPLPGRVLIFPSWLQHAVLPLEEAAGSIGESREARVSVACNFDLLK